jgi:hypothetical protein
MNCIHCNKPLVRDAEGTLIDDTGGDVCGTYGTYGNEPHVADDSNERYQLLGVNPDGSLAAVRGYTEISAFIGDSFDAARGSLVAAYVDDVGMYKGLAFNTVASIIVGYPIFGPAVLIDAEPDENGDSTLRPDTRQTAAALAQRWRHLRATAEAIGQSLDVFANADSVPPPVVYSGSDFEELFRRVNDPADRGDA